MSDPLADAAWNNALVAAVKILRAYADDWKIEARRRVSDSGEWHYAEGAARAYEEAARKVAALGRNAE